MLREAFVKSGEWDVFDWCDGRTLRELVGVERAKLVYGHPEKGFIGGSREGFAYLQDALNFSRWDVAVLVMRKYDVPYGERENDGYGAAYQLQFKAGNRSFKTPIDPAHWP